MPQVSLYLDQDVLDVARRNARIEKTSLSRYVTCALTKVAHSGWQPGYWNLFGALSDETFVLPEDVPFEEVELRASF